MKKILPIFVAFLLFSCQTSIIPGERALKVKNIYAEYYMLGDAYFENKKYEKAAEYYEKSAQLKSHRVASYYKAARAYAFAEKWDESLAIYKKLLKADPKNHLLRENIAYINLKTGNPEESKKIYDALISEDPDNKESLTRYIKFLAEMKAYDDAFAKIDIYIKSFGKDDEIEKLKKDIEEQKNPPKEEVEKTEETKKAQ